ncbi:MAG TPA: hypothetical protein VGM25_14560 [Caulobacteraceae bacterium]
MQTKYEYRSPDGQLCLVVEAVDGDVRLGFADMPWHTHGDVLASQLGLPIEAAVQAFVEALVGSATIVAVLKVNATVCDVWVPCNSVEDCRDRDLGEEITFRRWSG